jgi:hypothetical protein
VLCGTNSRSAFITAHPKSKSSNRGQTTPKSKTTKEDPPTSLLLDVVVGATTGTEPQEIPLRTHEVSTNSLTEDLLLAYLLKKAWY